MRFLKLFAFPLVIALCASLGCGDSGPKTVTVTGSVSFDGQPIPDGDILFRDASGNEGSAAGKIENGSYTLEATPGNKKVEIRAMREIAGKMDESNPGEAVPMQEMYIPKKYNSDSELAVEVGESGENNFDFPLESNS